MGLPLKDTHSATFRAVPEAPGATGLDRLMMLVCARPATRGGACVLVDGYAVHRDLLERAPAAVAALSAPGTAWFGGREGTASAVFTERGGGRLVVRWRWDALVRFRPEARPHLGALRAAMALHRRVLPLRAGEGYVIDNSRWLHGRTAFDGPRVCWRALGRPRSDARAVQAVVDG
jgi:hypothetical protein